MKLLKSTKSTLDFIEAVLSIVDQVNELLSHELIRRLLSIIEVIPIC